MDDGRGSRSETRLPLYYSTERASFSERGRNFLSRLLHPDDAPEIRKRQAGSKSIRSPAASDWVRSSPQKERDSESKGRHLNSPAERYQSYEESSDGEQYVTRPKLRDVGNKARRQSRTDSKNERSSDRTRSSATKPRDSKRRARLANVSFSSDEGFEEERPRSRLHSDGAEQRAAPSGFPTDEKDQNPEQLRTPDRTRSSATKSRDYARLYRSARFPVESTSSDDERARFAHSYDERNPEDNVLSADERIRRRTAMREEAALNYIRNSRAQDPILPLPSDASRDYYTTSSRPSRYRETVPDSTLPRRHDNIKNPHKRREQESVDDALRYIQKSRSLEESRNAAPPRPTPARTPTRDYYEPSSRSSALRDAETAPAVRRSSTRPAARSTDRDRGIPEVVDGDTRPATVPRRSSKRPKERSLDYGIPDIVDWTERPNSSTASPPGIYLSKEYLPLKRSPPPVPTFRRSATMPDAPIMRTGSRREARKNPGHVRDDSRGSSDIDADEGSAQQRQTLKEQQRQGTKIYHHSLRTRNETNVPKLPLSSDANAGHPSSTSSLDHSVDIHLVGDKAELEGARSTKRTGSQLRKLPPPQPEGETSDNGDDIQTDGQDAEVTLGPSLDQQPAKAPISNPATSTPGRGRINDPELYGWYKAHLVLGPTDEDILVATNPLGHGSLGVVDEVRHKNGRHPSFVRKRVKLPVQKRKAATYLNIAKEEARILRSLVHPHIVALVGSYEDMKLSRSPSYCLLMAPVGENDLETFLAIVGEHNVATEFSVHWRARIRSWMACLASALKYMHASGIRHQDIKPSNIIHKGDQIFFTDFSSSSTFKIGHTTSTENSARSTPMYGAPEVTSDRGRHGQTTDIFALGCVFSDMLSVSEGHTVSGFQEFLSNSGKPPAAESRGFRQGLSYSEKVPFISEWFAGSHLFDVCISRMLQADRDVRPRAAEVLQILMAIRSDNRSCLCLRAEVLQMDVDASSVISVD